MSDNTEKKKKNNARIKAWYAANPEAKKKHNAKSAEKIDCECGCTVRRSMLSVHKKLQNTVNYWSR